jgi:HSP20 family molecular chaperone IbpA
MSISGKKDGYKCVCDGCTCNHQERHCGSFIRRVQVPYGLKPDEVKADMDNG